MQICEDWLPTTVRHMQYFASLIFTTVEFHDQLLQCGIIMVSEGPGGTTQGKVVHWCVMQGDGLTVSAGVGTRYGIIVRHRFMVGAVQTSRS